MESGFFAFDTFVQFDIHSYTSWTPVLPPPPPLWISVSKRGESGTGLDEEGGNDTSTRLSNKLLEWQGEHSCQCVLSPLSVFRDVREQEGEAVFFLYDSSVSAVIVAGI